MSEVSASNLIWFTLTIVVALSLGATFIYVGGNIAEEVENDNQRTIRELESRIAIMNRHDEFNYDSESGNITLFLKNTGSRELSPRRLEIYLEGNVFVQDDMDTEIVDGNRWGEGRVLRAEIDSDIDEGEYHLEVNVGGYAEDDMAIRLGDNNG